MSRLRLAITAIDDVMVLPRILQTLSRRGWRLVDLTTEDQGSDCLYRCELAGDAKWLELMPKLIAKLPDVKGVDHVE